MAKIKCRSNAKLYNETRFDIHKEKLMCLINEDVKFTELFSHLCRLYLLPIFLFKNSWPLILPETVVFIGVGS